MLKNNDTSPNPWVKKYLTKMTDKNPAYWDYLFFKIKTSR
ncbi:MAG: hypothetical protein Rpha_0112 [Candidatus Ruthia sp. Apha_13_S6]|nr:hypothetical protein [Candidatus Ruthia sp. Apha_13_S6]